MGYLRRHVFTWFWNLMACYAYAQEREDQGIQIESTVHLKACNIDFAYLDSGAPGSADYTTLVCVHGHTYHAQTFRRLLPLAARHNIRLIAINRRDYVGSTPFNDVELAALNSADESQHRRFLFDRGLELAHFLLWVVNELKIPPACNDWKAGGLSLLGWSLGNITSVAFLAKLASYPDEMTQALRPYLRHFFIYETMFHFFGFAVPPGAYHPLSDPDITTDEKVLAIDKWFTSYFSHPYFSQLPDMRLRKLSALQLRAPSIPVKPPTSANRSLEEFISTTDAAPAMRSEISFFVTVRDTTLYEQFKAAFMSEDRSGSTILLLPNLKVSVIDGTNTVWSIIWGGWEVEKHAKRWKAEGMDVRPLDFVSIEGSNHFALWDEPELLMRTLAGCLTGPEN